MHAISAKNKAAARTLDAKDDEEVKRAGIQHQTNSGTPPLLMFLHSFFILHSQLPPAFVSEGFRRKLTHANIYIKVSHLSITYQLVFFFF